RYERLVFPRRHTDQGGLVLVLGQVPVDAVITGVELSAHEPLPEGWFAGVEHGVPALVPRQHLRVFLEAIREIRLAESFVYIGIGQIRLVDEFSGRIVQLLLPPVDCNLGFGGLTHHVLFMNIRHVNSPFHVSENYVYAALCLAAGRLASSSHTRATAASTAAV